MYTGWQMYGLLSLFDIVHAKTGLTTLTKYWLQQFLCSFILFSTLDSTKYLRIHNIRKNRNAWLRVNDNLSGLCVFITFVMYHGVESTSDALFTK